MLEAIAKGDPVDVGLETHVASCSTCQHAIDQIQENNRFLEQFAGDISDGDTDLHAVVDAPLPEILPGGYRVEYEIHRGGQGVIYRATQIRTKRSVAVKMLILGSSATERQQSRFEREAEIIASLRHPGIVTIYDAGRLKDGRFGFAMEFIDGLTIDQWAERYPVECKNDIHTRLELFANICDAVNFAHQQGVVHRDLKPANILVDKFGKPHILDFGIAKALEPVGLGSIASMGASGIDSSDARVNQTQPGEFAGTLAYASPEQVSGDPRSIDMRTDVYSLGIILYQLVTGKFPYEVDDSLQSVIHRIKHEIPKSPSVHTRFVDKDIDAMVLRTLRKEKEFRYDSVKDLHRDIKLYLEGKPIDTRRDSAWYVVHKTVRNHWLISSLAITSTVVLIVFATFMTVLYSQKSAAEVDALFKLRAQNLLLAHSEELHGDGELALNLLWSAQLEPSLGMPPPDMVRFGSAFEPLDSYWELWSFYAQNPCLKTVYYSENPPSQSVVNSDGSLLVTIESGMIHLRTLPDLELIRVVEFELHPTLGSELTIDHVVFSKNQNLIIAMTDQGTVQWDIEDGTLIEYLPMSLTNSQNPDMNQYRFPSSISGSRKFMLSPDGILGGGFPNTARIVRPSDPLDIVSLDPGEGQSTYLRFTNDGNLLATATVNQLNYNTARSKVSIWEMPQATLRAQIVTDGIADGLLFSSDNQTLVWSDLKSKLSQWNFSSSASHSSMITSDELGRGHCWYGESQDLVSSTNRTLSIRKLSDGRAVHVLFGHSDNIIHAVAPAGTLSLVSFDYKSAKSWDPEFRPWEIIAIPDGETIQNLTISPDGKQLAWTKADNGKYSVIITDLQSGTSQIALFGPQDLLNSVSFNHDGQLLASAGFDGEIYVWDLESGSILYQFNEHKASVHSVAMSPRENKLASGGDDNLVVLRDLDTGEVKILEGHTFRVPSVVFSPDGRLLASCSMSGSVCLWDVNTGELLDVYQFKDRFHAIGFSPDGYTLAVGGENKHVILINTKTGQRSELQSESGAIFALAFGPDGRVLVSGDRLGNLSLWDIERKTRLTRFPKHQDMIMGIAISADGQSMATCSSARNPEIRYWDLAGLAPHIAGNLGYHANELAETHGKRPENLDAMRRWADEILGSD